MSEPGESIEYIDVVIVMDITGSMQKWINSARDTVLEAFANIQKDYPDRRVRLGLVCYRDIGDQERFVLHPLTEDISDVQEKLKGIKASGGEDTSEDVAGALHHAIETFSSFVSETRICLFVADAPAHGSRYHTTSVSDRYPKGDPDGREPIEQVGELAKMGVDMTLFRIDTNMDKMIEAFAEAYSHHSDASFVLLDVVKQSVSNGYDKSSISGFIDLASYSCDKYSTPTRSSSDITSGFIDLTSYSCDKYSTPVRCPSDETFLTATYSSVAQSINRHRKKLTYDDKDDKDDKKC